MNNHLENNWTHSLLLTNISNYYLSTLKNMIIYFKKIPLIKFLSVINFINLIIKSDEIKKKMLDH